MLIKQFLKVLGSKIKSQAYLFSASKVQLSVEVGQELKFGQMVATIAVALVKELSKVTVFTFGRTDQGTKVNGSKTKCRGKVLLTGPTGETSKVSSKTE